MILVVFAPWAFGSAAVWSAWTTTGLMYAVGLAAVGRRVLGRLTGFKDPRWDVPGRGGHWLWALAMLSVLFLGYVGISLFNARALVRWNIDGFEFVYREAVAWLPTTYDLEGTRRGWIRYVALALAFWGAREWLQGMSRSERHRVEDGRMDRESGRVPRRLQRLLWTLALSTALMSLVGMVHRLDGSRELLWLKKVRMYYGSGMFGPYAYRANGAQYLNLIWPLVVGFWWVLRREAKRTLGRTMRAGASPHILLLPCAGLILLGTLVAASRGGIFIAMAELLAVLLVLGVRGRRQAGIGWFLGGTVLVTLAVGWMLSGEVLKKRFETVLTDEGMSGRTEIYENARKIAADFPLFGTGAESFMAIAGLYRAEPRGDWPAYVHNDWLETRVTFGWIGFGLVVALLLMLPVVHWRHGVLRMAAEFRATVWIALGGMLVHARFDFPFQMLSLILSFLVVAAVASVLAPFEEEPPSL